jgi:UbiD family decarboxylase
MKAFGSYSWLKFCVITDEDVDIFDWNDVLWAIATRVNPYTGQVKISHATGFPRDPYRLHSTKLGVDATVPITLRA